MLMMAAISIAAQHPPVGPQAVPLLPARRQPGRFGAVTASSASSGRRLAAPGHQRHLARPGRDLHRAGRRDQPPPGATPPTTRRRSTSSSTTSSGSATSASRDDDFGYLALRRETSRMPPSKIFGDVLRDGPPVGIHTIIWCDSVNNLNRTFDRQGTKEFENRILFQMSANDSSTLIDTPAASKLGENRALVLQRGRKPDREVPAVRPARAGMARDGEAPASPPGRCPRWPSQASAPVATPRPRSGRHARARLRRRQRRARPTATAMARPTAKATATATSTGRIGWSSRTFRPRQGTSPASRRSNDSQADASPPGLIGWGPPSQSKDSPLPCRPVRSPDDHPVRGLPPGRDSVPAAAASRPERGRRSSSHPASRAAAARSSRPGRPVRRGIFGRNPERIIYQCAIDLWRENRANSPIGAFKKLRS